MKGKKIKQKNVNVNPVLYRLRYVKPPEGAGVMEATPAETSDSQYHPPRITEMLSFNAAVLPLVKELGMQ